MIHIEAYKSCSVNEGSEMHGCNAEWSIAPTERCSHAGPACRTQHQHNLRMNKIQSTILQG